MAQSSKTKHAGFEIVGVGATPVIASVFLRYISYRGHVGHRTPDQWTHGSAQWVSEWRERRGSEDETEGSRVYETCLAALKLWESLSRYKRGDSEWLSLV